MTNDETMTKAEEDCKGEARAFVIWTFGLPSSFELRHSCLIRMIRQIASREGAPIFFVAFGRGLFLRCGNRLFDLRDCIFAPFGQRLRVNEIKVDNCLLGHLQAIARERLLLDLLRYVARIVV